MVEFNEEDLDKIGELSGRVFIKMMKAGDDLGDIMDIFIDEGFKMMGFEVPKVGKTTDVLTLKQASQIAFKVMDKNDLNELFPGDEQGQPGDATE